MDFFAAQDRARATSRRLVWWFVLCVIAVIAVIYFAAVLARPWFDRPSLEAVNLHWWDPQLVATVAPAITCLILVGSFYKLSQLSGGGSVVARDLGGRLVSRSTSEPLERRLVNVVDEMAIAAGLPAPEIWLLENEPGINAFAAGTDPTNAVIGVTSGCLERLDRDELQGVIAHEFSHILNGDMKLNHRLMGWIFGLVMISMLGKGLLRLLEHVRPSRGNSKEGGGIILIVVVAGAVLWLVGALGVFFARLLQAGVSRQREFLADASAVQFTRNPAGIAGALKKIGGLSVGGNVLSANAAEARHLFFGASGGFSLGFRSHPPLEERILAIEPGWDGKMVKSKSAGGSPFTRHPMPGVPQPVFVTNPGDAGRLDSGVGIAIQRSLMEKGLQLENKEDAKALVLGMLLAQGQGRETSEWLLETGGGEALMGGARSWAVKLAGITATERLALLDLSLPFLRRMTSGEGAAFIGLTERLIMADGRVSLFEFMLQRLIARQVGVGLGLRALPRVRYLGLGNVAREVATVVRTFGSVSGDPASIARAEEEYRLHTGTPLPEASVGGFDPEVMAAALEKIEATPQLAKIQVLRLCGLVVTHDGRLDDREMELLRATAEAIGAPVPPFVRLLKQVDVD